MSKIIDLSMEVSEEMITHLGISKPIITLRQSHEECADNVGATKFGISSLVSNYIVVISDQAGTHIDSMNHVIKDGPGADTIPLNYCYGDGVILDFSDKPSGYEITEEDIINKLKEINYELKTMDIVIIKTGAYKYNNQNKYTTDYCGMGKEATLFLINKGVKLIGIDAPTLEPPLVSTYKCHKFWESHMLVYQREFYHIENLANIDSIDKPYGFKIIAMPVKWKGTSGAPVRAVAIVE